MEKKKLIVMFTILMVTCCIFADKYKVLYVNSKDIKIANKNAVVGTVFADKDKILWSNDQQAMKVINLSTQKVMVLAAKALHKKNANSLYEYLTNKRHLSTRDLNMRKTMEVWQVDSILYLVDTLFLSRPYTKWKAVVARVVDESGYVMDLPISKDGKSYIITEAIYRRQTQRPQRFIIKEFDGERNWEYIVFRKLVIEPVGNAL